MREALEDCAGSAIPQGDQGKGLDCLLTAPVAPWQGRSYQELKVRQPTRSGGLGLSIMEDLSPVAFLGGCSSASRTLSGLKDSALC